MTISLRFGSVRFGSVRFGSVRFGSLLATLTACPTGGGVSGEQPHDFEVCDTDAAALAGGWSPQTEDWSNVAEDQLTNDQIDSPVCGHSVILQSHHCFLTAVHAVHMHTGELLLYHGERDVRVWPIGGSAIDMRWLPPPVVTSYWAPDMQCPGTNPQLVLQENIWPDIFCSGHLPLADGRVLVAGGNVTTSPGGGGLNDLLAFDPDDPTAKMSATEASCPFGWTATQSAGVWTNPLPRMEYDRWYPTLTQLADGRVLIAGGTSNHDDASAPCAARKTNVLEVYDPTAPPASAMVTLDQPDAIFSLDEGMPLYPLMFLLPNGDVFYAGAEDADELAEFRGRVLIVDYADIEASAWHEHEFTSTIGGASAAMVRPGVILKTGGHEEGTSGATNKAEIIDLSEVAAGDYDFAPENPDDPATPDRFVEVSPMGFARHYHNMTLLPDGRVLVVGGNTGGNAVVDAASDHYNNQCEVAGVALAEQPCMEGCPSTCINYNPTYPSESMPNCLAAPPADMRCSLLDQVLCETGSAPEQGCEYWDTDQAACERRIDCEWEGGSGADSTGGGETGNSGGDGAGCNSVGADLCGEAMPGATCDGTRCVKPCDSDSDCSPIEPVGGQCQVTDVGGVCGPHNNACSAVYTAEIYDPACDEWTPLGDQLHPRMYHSTALLLPDASVISMGGGHRDFGWRALEEQTESEYLIPQYALDANAPRPLLVDPEFESDDQPPYWQLGTERLLGGGDSSEVGAKYATLVKLGSATHGFDMNQRIVFLDLEAEDDANGTGWSYTAKWQPSDFELANTVPPGYYMLFLLSEAREPSLGHYVRVGTEPTVSAICETTPGFSATKTSCAVEPIGGVCPTAGQVVTVIAPPQVQGPAGLVSGFEVYTHPGIVEDLAAPTAAEIAEVHNLCATACHGWVGGRPGVTANCDDPGVFATPVGFAQDVAPALDLIARGARRGQGVLGGVQQLTCDLDEDCHLAFDEDLGTTLPARPTVADRPVSVGEEYRVGLGTLSKMEIVSGTKTFSTKLTGSVGYSFCRDGSAFAPCPFYLGSFDAAGAASVTPTLTCADGSKQRVTLSNLVVNLSQPAFGIAESGASTTRKGFPAGALVFEAAFDVAGQHYVFRRANADEVVFDASGSTISATNLILHAEVPCNRSTADVAVKFTVKDPGNGAALGKPPVVTITAPSTSSVPCGSTVTLSHAASDPDGDLAEVRWLVDGVPLAVGTTSIAITGSRELRAVARDARGAATTAKKVVSCF